MRRLATIGAAVGLAVFMAFMSSAPANAAGKWSTAGVEGVKAWGTYYTSSYKGKKTKVVDARIKDNRRDGRRAAILIKWTKSGYEPDYQWMWSKGGYGSTARGAAQSYNTSHLRIKECVGNVKGGRFKPAKCGKYRVFY